MSDFLSRLAGRTMGLALTVQPMIAPMYAHGTIQPGLAPFDGDISAPVEREPLPASAARDTRRAPILPDNPLTAQADPYQEPASARGEYADKTPGNYLLPGDGSASNSPDMVSRRDRGLSPTVEVPSEIAISRTFESVFRVPTRHSPLADAQARGAEDQENSIQSGSLERGSQSGRPAVPSFPAEHKDGVSILAEETTFHNMDTSLRVPNGPEQVQGGVRKDGDYKNVQFAPYGHTLPMDEPSQTVISSPGSLSMQDNPLSQRVSTAQQRMSLTGDMPVVHHQSHANNAQWERRAIGGVPDGVEHELEEERTRQRDLATLLPMQEMPATRVSYPTGHGSLKRGNVGGTTHQTGQDETLSMAATTPSVQVTIGRIEVRATPPPPTRPPAQRTAPSVMSLDDYVNQRMKGGC